MTQLCTQCQGLTQTTDESIWVRCCKCGHCDKKRLYVEMI